MLHTSASLVDVGGVAVGFPPTWPAGAAFIDAAAATRDMQFGGRGRIYGTVKIRSAPNYPVRRRVLLIAERDGRCIAERWSDAVTGDYEFANILETLRYTVAAYDYTRSLRIVLADNITPELMP